jgi:hypothetical protein
MFSMVFTKESITKDLNNLKIGKAPGIDDIPNEFLKYGKKYKINVSRIWKKPC